MIEVFSKDVIKSMAGSVVSENPELRFGQAVYNLCFDTFPQQVKMLNGKEEDCFYDNGKVDIFLDELSKLINKGVKNGL